MQEVTISMERFQQLIRAEQDANQLKALITDKLEHYGTIDREVMKILSVLYCGYNRTEG